METEKPQTLAEWQEHFFAQYGPRNRLRLTGPVARVGLLSLAAKDLQDAIRKRETLMPEILGIALARVVARLFCIAEHYLNLPLAASFAAKYMAGECSYCHERPCVCSESRRGESARAEPSRTDLTLRECCAELKANYGEANKAKGIENLINRLFSEVGEILSLVMDSLASDMSNEELSQEIADELADTLAWTIAVSNFLGVDLQGALEGWFWPHCRVCLDKPCKCGRFSVRLVKWSEFQAQEL